MRRIWLFTVALTILPNSSFAQGSSSHCVLQEDRVSCIGALNSDEPALAPHILKPLKDEDWDVRAKAARTLHLTRGSSAAPYLIDAISPRDWKLTFEAMNSLKKLQVPEADEVLRIIAKTYWHPAIANAADDLLKGKILPDQPQATPQGLFDGDVIRKYCEAGADRTLLPRCSLDTDDAQEIASFNQERQDYSRRFIETFKNTPILKDARPIGPNLKTSDGEFVGIDNGEFGGELVFANGPTRQTVLSENILAIAKQGNRIIVVTGLNHMITDEGFILEVARGSEGLWKAKRLWRLPGAPHQIVITPDGSIGLHGYFGSVLYKPDDSLTWLACGQSYQCRK